MCWYSWLAKSSSKSLAITGRTEIGRKFDISGLSPYLKIGVTLAHFHRSGNWLVSIDVLNKSANDFSIKGMASFKK